MRVPCPAVRERTDEGYLLLLDVVYTATGRGVCCSGASSTDVQSTRGPGPAVGKQDPGHRPEHRQLRQAHLPRPLQQPPPPLATPGTDPPIFFHFFLSFFSSKKSEGGRAGRRWGSW